MCTIQAPSGTYPIQPVSAIWVHHACCFAKCASFSRKIEYTRNTFLLSQTCLICNSPPAKVCYLAFVILQNECGYLESGSIYTDEWAFLQIQSMILLFLALRLSSCWKTIWATRNNTIPGHISQKKCKRPSIKQINKEKAEIKIKFTIKINISQSAEGQAEEMSSEKRFKNRQRRDVSNVKVRVIPQLWFRNPQEQLISWPEKAGGGVRVKQLREVGWGKSTEGFKSK